GEDVGDLGHAGLWGLVRTAQSEHPDRRLILIDIDDEEAAWAAALATGETQLAVRAGKLVAPRLTRAKSEGGLRPPTRASWRLDIPRRGTLEALALVKAPERVLGAHEVRIAVRAAGLNFRDVLSALGMTNETGALGLEGAGVVLEVGADVDGMAPGDRVMGIFEGA